MFAVFVPLVHATTIFSDGQVGSTMETAGTFGAWTGVSASGTATNTVSTNWAQEGSNSYKCYLGGSSYYDAYIYEDFTGASQENFRVYFKLTTASFASGDARAFLAAYCSTIGTNVAWLGIQDSTFKLVLHYLTGAYVDASVVSATTISLNTAYCLELQIQVLDTTHYTLTVYLNGSAVTDLTVTNQSYNGAQYDCNEIQVGSDYGAGTYPTYTCYFDSIVVANAYVGTLGATASITYAFTLGKSFGVQTSYFASLSKSFTFGKSIGVVASYFASISKSFSLSKSFGIASAYFASISKSFSFGKSITAVMSGGSFIANIGYSFIFGRTIGALSHYFANPSYSFTFSKSMSAVASGLSYIANIGYSFVFGISTGVSACYSAGISYVFNFGKSMSATMPEMFTAAIGYAFTFAGSITSTASYFANIIYNFRWFQMITQPFQLGMGGANANYFWLLVFLIAIIGVPVTVYMFSNRRHK